MHSASCEIWLDDARDPKTHGWEGARWFKTAEALQAWLEARADWSDVVMSLDHDLGSGRMTGHDLMVWMETQVHEHARRAPKAIDLHTQSPAGKETMRASRNRIYHAKRARERMEQGS